MLKKSFAVLLCVLFCSLSDQINARQLPEETKSQLAQIEDSLVVLTDSMYNAFLPDERPAYCERFVRQLVRGLKLTNSFDYDFPQLKKKINIIAPSDNSFRIFNWLIVGPDNQVRYYGAVQMPSENLKLYALVDHSKELGKYAADSILTNSEWFGALYYRIVPTEADGRKIYNLLGLNSSSLVSNKKVIDPLLFTENGIVFGAPIFNISSENAERQINRFIIEYKKRSAGFNELG